MGYKLKDGSRFETLWFSNLVNAHSTKEERRGKYWFLRSLGVSCLQAVRQRDWRLSKIERLYKARLNENRNDNTT